MSDPAYNELSKLLEFMEQLTLSGMHYEDMVARSYDFALALYRSREEQALPRGTEISSALQVLVMDHAADLLKKASHRYQERPKE